MSLVHCEGEVNNNTVNNTQALPAVNEDEDANSLAPPQVQPTLPPISGPAVSSVEGEERCGLLPESKQPEALPSHQQALPSVQVDQTGQTLSARHSSRERLDVNALNLSALRDAVGSSGSGRDSARLLEEGGSDVFYEADDGLEQKQTLQATTDLGRFVIAPDSKFGMCWKVLITLLSMLVILVAPVNFSQSWATGSVIVVVCQFVFLIDVYLHLFHVVDGETVSFAHFRRAYLRSWFVVDVVSAIPFGVFEEVVHVGNALVLLRLLHLPSYLGTIRGYILDHGFD